MSSKSNKDIVDPKKFRHTRFKTYQQCPLKHYYIYEELIETDPPSATIPGKLFHAAIEAILKGESAEDIFTEFENLCYTGVLDMEANLLRYIVQKYMQYYKHDYSVENIIVLEEEFTEPLSKDGDYMSVTVDQVVENKLNETIVIRDIKTTRNSLKYTQSDVQINSQLLLYVPYVEENTGIKVDAVQIDEVRMEFLREPPINANGKPTADKKRLELTTYEDYSNLLHDMGLASAPEYRAIQDYLKERGHPLFRRVTAQILDDRLVDTNLADLHATYQTIKATAKIKPYRVTSRLCNYCEFKTLCDLDRYMPSEVDREIAKNNLKTY